MWERVWRRGNPPALLVRRSIDTDTMEYCSCSVTQLCLTLCDSVNSSTLGFPILYYLPEFIQTHVHWISDAIQPSHPLSSPSPPTFNLAQCQDLFQWVSHSHQVAKVLELQLQHLSFQWIFSISFGVDRFGLLAVQRTLKSLVQDNTSKASIFLCSVFFMVQLPHLYMTTGKTIALTIQTFVSKVCLCSLIHCLCLS